MNKPFQTFDEHGDASHCAKRVEALRAELGKRDLDGFLIPRADEHQGEYVPARAERLTYVSGFTGSAGQAVVLKDKAAIFVDGRYTLQVRDQTDTEIFETHDSTNDGAAKWIEANLPKGAKLGYDPWLHTQGMIETLAQAAVRAGTALTACDANLIDAIWKDQPPAPAARATPYPIELAGESSQSKRGRIAENLKQRKADAAVLTLPDSICWLLNIRGADVPHTPFVLSFALHHADGSTELFMDPRKSSPELLRHLGNGVTVRSSEEFASALDALKGKNVLADPSTGAAFVFDRLARAGAFIQRAADPCQLPKACKNKVELDGARRAHIRDGQAMTRFLAWFAREAPKGGLTEIDAVEKLEALRAETGVLKDISFDSISGAGPHGAIPHYRVTRNTNLKIELGQLFLIDSGAQYEDGTTDVTRTIAVGTPSDEMRDRFTRVLKGHIALATVRFPDGTTGAQLDPFARRPLWDAGLDYGHGTGHGVGAYLSVHEGPQSISPRGTQQALRPGMICSIEPGYYKTGEYGIRIENLVVVKELESAPSAPSFELAAAPPGGEKPMLGFETLTLAPIDLDLVDMNLLTMTERIWLNAYHAQVRKKVGPTLGTDPDARAWLEQATRTI